MENLDWEREHLKDIMYLGERKFEEEQEELMLPAKIIIQKQNIKENEYSIKSYNSTF